MPLKGTQTRSLFGFFDRFDYSIVKAGANLFDRVVRAVRPGSVGEQSD
jgi:hypothetical protein